VIQLVLVLGVLAAVPGTASATVFTYCGASGTGANCNFVGNNPETAQPQNYDIGDLDHNYFYTWRLNNLNLTGGALTSATITFKQMYNWDTNQNQLFLGLLDNAINAGIASAYDGPDNTLFQDAFTVATMRDDLVTAATAGIALTQRSFAALGAAPGTAPGPGSNVFPSGGWSVVADGVNASGQQLYTYTYTFTEAQEDVLEAYIANGQNIAIALDPDCHFFNDGIALTLTTGPAIPEPLTVVLISAGLAAAGYRRRRRS
jgi:hypothetical protein